MTGDAPVNWLPARGGRCRAVCSSCDALSPKTMGLHDGNPRLKDLHAGWSMAPYPADFVQLDGSTGATFTCRACSRLREQRRAAGIRPLLSPSPARQAAIVARRESIADDGFAPVYDLQSRRPGPATGESAEPIARTAT